MYSARKCNVPAYVGLTLTRPNYTGAISKTLSRYANGLMGKCGRGGGRHRVDDFLR